MLRRPHYIAVGAVVLLTLVVLNLPGRTTARLKLALGSLFLPLFGLAGAAQQGAARAGDALTPRGELLRQNEALRRENQELRSQLQQAAETARENARLRQLVGWKPPGPWQRKLARVVFRDPANWWRTVQIDVGARDGVRENLPVLTTDGLVGRIAAVGLARSQVVLVGDPNCRVAAVVENETRDLGIIGASTPLDHSLVEMNCYLARGSNLQPGQWVKTSGQGGIFPRGIPIGQVADTRQVEYGLYTEAHVKLAVNLNGLEEVWVLMP